MNQKYTKITQVILVLFVGIVGYVSRVVFEFLATVLGFVAKIYSIESVRHGLPVGIAITLFIFLQWHPKIKAWLRAVILEVDKVVWPTKKDTLSMTFVVCVVLIISGIVLGLFDLISGTLVQYVLS